MTDEQLIKKLNYLRSFIKDDQEENDAYWREHENFWDLVIENIDSILRIMTDNQTNAAKVLGRLGGLKGGDARAMSLSSKRRSEIAKKAAAARWFRG